MSENLKRLMDDAKPRITQVAVAEVSGLPQRTISRIKRGEVSPTLESVDALARAFRLDSWQLLIPGLEPSNPPVLRVAGKEEKELYDRILSAAKELSKIKD